MINYRIQKKNKEFDIFETRTEQVIASVPNKEQAQKIAMHLNMGGGFDGWSPEFFLKTIKYK